MVHIHPVGWELVPLSVQDLLPCTEYLHTQREEGYERKELTTHGGGHLVLERQGSH